MQQRDVTCRDGIEYRIVWYSDNDVGIFGANGDFIAGWPETASFAGSRTNSLTHEELAARVRRMIPPKRVGSVAYSLRWAAEHASPRSAQRRESISPLIT